MHQREMIVRIQMERTQVPVLIKHLVSRDPLEFSSDSSMKCCFSDPEVSLRSGPTSKTQRHLALNLYLELGWAQRAAEARTSQNPW